MKWLTLGDWLGEIRKDLRRQSHRDQKEILSYKNLLEHLAEHEHDPRKWFLKAAWQDDAQTIGQAVQRMSKRQFARRLARILCK